MNFLYQYVFIFISQFSSYNYCQIYILWLFFSWVAVAKNDGKNIFELYEETGKQIKLDEQKLKVDIEREEKEKASESEEKISTELEPTTTMDEVTGELEIVVIFLCSSWVSFFPRRN